MRYKIEGSKVEKLVVARHGEHGPDGSLSVYGRKDIANLSDQLELYLTNKILSPGSAIITYSEADRAKESASIMAGKLGITAILKSSLGDIDGKDYFGQEARILEEFEALANSYPCIIAITHEPITAYFPMIILPKINSDQGRITNYAWARVYDEDGRMTTISPDEIFLNRTK